MNRFILAPHVYDHTAQALARCISDISVLHNTSQLPSDSKSLIIRWGHTGGTDEDTGFVLNRKTSIELAADKEKTLQELSAVNIPCLQIVTTELIDNMADLPSASRVIVNRKHGFGGRYTRYLDPAISIQPSEFATVFYPKQAEYRVHVAFGRVLLLQNKIPRLPEPGLIWNAATCTFQVVPWHEFSSPLYTHIIEIALRTIAHLGLDFGAVDILHYASDPQPAVVCEVNTAPKLTGHTLDKYVWYFEQMFTNANAEGFPIPQYHHSYRHPASYPLQCKHFISL